MEFYTHIDDELAVGDRIIQLGNQAALDYGWWANEWIKKEASLSDADPDSRAAFSFALTVLEERHGRWISRSQICDRIRVCKIFPRETYEEICEELNYIPSFSQLRAAYVKDDYKKSMELLLWAAENDANPIDINTKKMGSVAEPEDEKIWRHIQFWASRYGYGCFGKSKARDDLVLAILKT